MSEVTPPPIPPPTTTPTPRASQPTVVIPNPPQALTELAVGARIEAAILAVAARGRVELDTAFGRLLAQTAFPLPGNGPLQLQVLAKGPQLQLLITAIHGLAPQAALRALGLGPAGAAAARSPTATAEAGRGAASPTAPASAAARAAAGGAPGVATPAQAGALTGPPAIELLAGATLAATLLRAGPPGRAAPGATAQATGGQPSAPGGGAAAATGGGGSAAGAPATGTGRAAGPAGAAGPAATGPGIAGARAGGPAPVAGSVPEPPAGTLLTVRVAGFRLATGSALPSPPPAGPPLAPGGILTGVATGQTAPSGHPIIETHAGQLMIVTRTPLPPGSTVTFEVVSQALPPAEGAGHPAPALRPGPPSLFERWVALEEAVRVLEEVNPAAAQQLIAGVMPRPGVTLAANVLFFLVALTGGGLRGWMGDGPTRILEKLRPELMTRLRDDFGRIARVADDRTSGDWRTLPIPFYNGAEIEQIRLSLRRFEDEADDENAAGRRGTRFVIDLDLSRLGRFQLDGLVYQKEKHMDLVVRTENRLPHRIRDGIREIFENAGDTTGFKGGIAFQAAPPNFVEVSGGPATDDALGLIV